MPETLMMPKTLKIWLYWAVIVPSQPHPLVLSRSGKSKLTGLTSAKYHTILMMQNLIINYFQSNLKDIQIIKYSEVRTKATELGFSSTHIL